MNEKEILKLKKKIDNAEHEVQQLKGEKRAILVNLKEDFDCTTIEEAKTKRKELKNKIKTIEKELNSKLEELNKKYSQDE